MNSITIGVIIFVCMIVAVLIGVPIYIAVLSAATIGLLIVGSPQILVQQISTGMATVSANYNFAVIPLFIVVGVLAGETALGEGIFVAGEKWLGRIRGGLLYAVVLGNAIFGACSGISSAGSIVFAKVATPSLNKAGYDENLSLGTIAAAGVLSCLIPPSVGIMTFCLLTDQSVGTGLTTGLAGGILMVVVMLLGLFIYFHIRPQVVPEKSEVRYSMKEKLATLKLLVPVIALFVLIVGGAFFGWFPATVGGAVASVAIIIYGFAKKIGFRRLYLCIWEGAHMFAGIFVIIVGSSLFSRFVSITGLAEAIVDIISKSGFPALLVMLIIVAFYALCGCVMDAMSIILITVPIVYPLLTGLGYNGLVICVILVLCAELGAITPPMGVSVFTVASVLRISPSKIFKGVWPFVIIYLVMIVLCILFPDLLLWLPRLMGGNV